MYIIKFIDGVYFHIDNEDYKRIIDAINSDSKFIQIIARYTKFKDVKMLINIKHILYINET